MGACAEIDEFRLLVEADRFALAGMFGGELYLIGFTEFFEKCKSVLRRLFKAADLDAGLDDLLHFRLDFGDIVGIKRLCNVKIIVEALVDRRADGELCLGIKALDRLRENMRGGVPERLFAVFVSQRCAQVADLAVNHGGTDVFVQSHGNRLGDFGGGDIFVKFLDDAALEFNVDHILSLLYIVGGW